MMHGEEDVCIFDTWIALLSDPSSWTPFDCSTDGAWCEESRRPASNAGRVRVPLHVSASFQARGVVSPVLMSCGGGRI